MLLSKEADPCVCVWGEFEKVSFNFLILHIYFPIFIKIKFFSFTNFIYFSRINFEEKNYGSSTASAYPRSQNSCAKRGSTFYIYFLFILVLLFSNHKSSLAYVI